MSNQTYPLQEPFESSVKNSIENSPVPRELEMKIKEEFQKNRDMGALEDKYGVTLVRQILGEKSNEMDNKKNEDGQSPLEIAEMFKADGLSFNDAVKGIMEECSWSKSRAEAVVSKVYKKKNSETEEKKENISGVSDDELVGAIDRITEDGTVVVSTGDLMYDLGEGGYSDLPSSRVRTLMTNLAAKYKSGLYKLKG
jgi:hypothetical protein